MKNEERLEQQERLKSQPPFDLSKPLVLPQAVIETMARCLQKIVRKEQEAEKRPEADRKES